MPADSNGDQTQHLHPLQLPAHLIPHTTMANEDSQPPPTTSYFYPVRSLLTGLPTVRPRGEQHLFVITRLTGFSRSDEPDSVAPLCELDSFGLGWRGERHLCCRYVPEATFQTREDYFHPVDAQSSPPEHGELFGAVNIAFDDLAEAHALRPPKLDGPSDVSSGGETEAPSDTTSIVLLPPRTSSTAPSSATGASAPTSERASSRTSDMNSTEGVEAEQPSVSEDETPPTRESSEEAFHYTTRFEHKQDSDGHHVILGREGELTRCEDEPIRIPGAVQGFGVLVAVRENEETGDFAVRQVSEASFPDSMRMS